MNMFTLNPHNISHLGNLEVILWIFAVLGKYPKIVWYVFEEREDRHFKNNVIYIIFTHF